jgi:predicted nucleic-acid-binding Zn-ribbon protein
MMGEEKVVCPKCQNDTFNITEKKLSDRMLASRERTVTCTECGYSENLYKIGD